MEMGQYYSDEDNDDEINLEVTNPNREVYLARDNIAADMKLDEFEKAVKAVIQDHHTLNKRNESNAIPEEIRQELNLPKDMKGFEIDFNQVRITDASKFKKIKRKWSG